MGYKMACNGVDNGLLSFNKVVIPAENMLVSNNHYTVLCTFPFSRTVIQILTRREISFQKSTLVVLDSLPLLTNF